MVWTIQEAADYLKISPRTMYRLVVEGHVHGVRIGKQWRISNEEIERVLRDGVPEDTGGPSSRLPRESEQDSGTSSEYFGTSDGPLDD